MLDQSMWDKLYSHIKNHLLGKYITGFTPDSEIRNSFKRPHVGFYIMLESSAGDEIASHGFMNESLTNIVDSSDIVVRDIFDKLNDKKVDKSKIETATFYLTIVEECTFIKNPLHWDENKDGVYFQWGQQYSGIYLPYEIRKMNCPKLEILDKLCAWKAGVASSLWRVPEGLCYRLVCSSYSA